MSNGGFGCTDHQAKYFAYELTRLGASGADRLSMSLFDAAVDLNPHQIEAALFALHSPISQGAILADEVGLGKTIEAGIVLCQFWAERKRRLLVICPASLRAQWAAELSDKFNLPAVVIDSKVRRDALRLGRDPLIGPHIVVASFNFVHTVRDEIGQTAWDLVVIDEAHKLRNVYKPDNKIAHGIKEATDGCRKLLLTATPLQNSLLELYGLSTLIDDHLFGDVDSFRSQFMAAGSSLAELRTRLGGLAARTLRRDVLEYVRYTQRRAITQPFRPGDQEHALYEAVSAFLQQNDLHSLPPQQRHLTLLVLRKLLASSSVAIAGTLRTMQNRLLAIREAASNPVVDDAAEPMLFDSDVEGLDELLDEILAEGDEQDIESDAQQSVANLRGLGQEIDELGRLIALADSVGEDAKAPALLQAIRLGFEQMAELGAPHKALVFTESRRTQLYLKDFLEANGFANHVVLFNGSNGGAEVSAIHDRWLAAHVQAGGHPSSRDVDTRTALIDHFRSDASIMIATEAAAEGVNMQFCSLVVNYDLPWNPQRIEQRIGRCHRYGQQHDVVVVNFLNERNDADRRVLELLGEKFRLFDGVFGASDEVLGAVESGVDFEQRVLAIYQQCRTSHEIESAFTALQLEMDDRIRARMDTTREALFEHFDEDVHERLRLRLEDVRARLGRFGQRFWAVTHHVLADMARFDDADLSFELLTPPVQQISAGRYVLLSKGAQPDPAAELYRLSHPLGEFVIGTAKAATTGNGRLVFDVTHRAAKISVVADLAGTNGVMSLERLVVDSFDREEYLLFSGLLSDGRALEQETVEKMFNCDTRFEAAAPARELALNEALAAEADHQAAAAVSRSLDQNNEHFKVARDRLEKWADDMVVSAEKALADTKQNIKVLRREARMATTLAEQHAMQEKLQRLERQQRRQRQQIFDVEDQIAERRDELIGALERRMAQRTARETLFTVEFAIV